MKTPEKIKKGLEPCKSAPYFCESCACEFRCKVEADALAYIQQLEHAVEFYGNTNQMLDAKIAKLEYRLAQVERERDAAVFDLGKAMSLDEVEDCSFCKNNKKPYCDPCKWEWRGVCAENTKENEHHG